MIFDPGQRSIGGNVGELASQPGPNVVLGHRRPLLSAKLIPSIVDFPVRRGLHVLEVEAEENIGRSANEIRLLLRIV